MNKEKETLLNKFLSEPDVPYLVSKKSINRLIERMQPETEDMKEYLIAANSTSVSGFLIIPIYPQLPSKYAICQ